MNLHPDQVYNKAHIQLASPDHVRGWTHRSSTDHYRYNARKINCARVTKGSTYDYKNLRPTKGGLFCETIFGKLDQRHKRRTHHGFVELASPTMHVWYLKGHRASYASLLVNRKRKVMERFVYTQAMTPHNRAAFDQPHDLSQVCGGPYGLSVERLIQSSNQRYAIPWPGSEPGVLKQSSHHDGTAAGIAQSVQMGAKANLRPSVKRRSVKRLFRVGVNYVDSKPGSLATGDLRPHHIAGLIEPKHAPGTTHTLFLSHRSTRTTTGDGMRPVTPTPRVNLNRPWPISHVTTTMQNDFRGQAVRIWYHDDHVNDDEPWCHHMVRRLTYHPVLRPAQAFFIDLCLRHADQVMVDQQRYERKEVCSVDTNPVAKRLAKRLAKREPNPIIDADVNLGDLYGRFFGSPTEQVATYTNFTARLAGRMAWWRQATRVQMENLDWFLVRKRQWYFVRQGLSRSPGQVLRALRYARNTLRDSHRTALMCRKGWLDSQMHRHRTQERFVGVHRGIIKPDAELRYKENAVLTKATDKMTYRFERHGKVKVTQCNHARRAMIRVRLSTVAFVLLGRHQGTGCRRELTARHATRAFGPRYTCRAWRGLNARRDQGKNQRNARLGSQPRQGQSSSGVSSVLRSHNTMTHAPGDPRPRLVMVTTVNGLGFTLARKAWYGVRLAEFELGTAPKDTPGNNLGLTAHRSSVVTGVVRLDALSRVNHVWAALQTRMHHQQVRRRELQAETVCALGGTVHVATPRNPPLSGLRWWHETSGLYGKATVVEPRWRGARSWPFPVDPAYDAWDDAPRCDQRGLPYNRDRASTDTLGGVTRMAVDGKLNFGIVRTHTMLKTQLAALTNLNECNAERWVINRALTKPKDWLLRFAFVSATVRRAWYHCRDNATPATTMVPLAVSRAFSSRRSLRKLVCYKPLSRTTTNPWAKYFEAQHAKSCANLCRDNVRRDLLRRAMLARSHRNLIATKFLGMTARLTYQPDPVDGPRPNATRTHRLRKLLVVADRADVTLMLHRIIHHAGGRHHARRRARDLRGLLSVPRQVMTRRVMTMRLFNWIIRCYGSQGSWHISKELRRFIIKRALARKGRLGAELVLDLIIAYCGSRPNARRSPRQWPWLLPPAWGKWRHHYEWRVDRALYRQRRAILRQVEDRARIAKVLASLHDLSLQPLVVTRYPIPTEVAHGWNPWCGMNRGLITSNTPESRGTTTVNGPKNPKTKDDDPWNTMRFATSGVFDRARWNLAGGDGATRIVTDRTTCGLETHDLWHQRDAWRVPTLGQPYLAHVDRTRTVYAQARVNRTRPRLVTPYRRRHRMGVWGKQLLMRMYPSALLRTPAIVFPGNTFTEFPTPDTTHKTAGPNVRGDLTSPILRMGVVKSRWAKGTYCHNTMLKDADMCDARQVRPTSPRALKLTVSINSRRWHHSMIDWNRRGYARLAKRHSKLDQRHRLRLLGLVRRWHDARRKEQAFALVRRLDPRRLSSLILRLNHWANTVGQEPLRSKLRTPHPVAYEARQRVHPELGRIMIRPYCRYIMRRQRPLLRWHHARQRGLPRRSYDDRRLYRIWHTMIRRCLKEPWRPLRDWQDLQRRQPLPAFLKLLGRWDRSFGLRLCGRTEFLRRAQQQRRQCSSRWLARYRNWHRDRYRRNDHKRLHPWAHEHRQRWVDYRQRWVEQHWVDCRPRVDRRQHTQDRYENDQRTWMPTWRKKKRSEALGLVEQLALSDPQRLPILLNLLHDWRWADSRIRRALISSERCAAYPLGLPSWFWRGFYVTGSEPKAQWFLSRSTYALKHVLRGHTVAQRIPAMDHTGYGTARMALTVVIGKQREVACFKPAPKHRRLIPQFARRMTNCGFDCFQPCKRAQPYHPLAHRRMARRLRNAYDAWLKIAQFRSHLTDSWRHAHAVNETLGTVTYDRAVDCHVLEKVAVVSHFPVASGWVTPYHDDHPISSRSWFTARFGAGIAREAGIILRGSSQRRMMPVYRRRPRQPISNTPWVYWALGRGLSGTRGLDLGLISRNPPLRDPVERPRRHPILPIRPGARRNGKAMTMALRTWLQPSAYRSTGRQSARRGSNLTSNGAAYRETPNGAAHKGTLNGAAYLGTLNGAAHRGTPNSAAVRTPLCWWRVGVTSDIEASTALSALALHRALNGRKKKRKQPRRISRRLKLRASRSRSSMPGHAHHAAVKNRSSSAVTRYGFTVPPRLTDLLTRTNYRCSAWLAMAWTIRHRRNSISCKPRSRPTMRKLASLTSFLPNTWSHLTTFVRSSLASRRHSRNRRALVKIQHDLKRDAHRVTNRYGITPDLYALPDDQAYRRWHDLFGPMPPYGDRVNVSYTERSLTYPSSATGTNVIQARLYAYADCAETLRDRYDAVQKLWVRLSLRAATDVQGKDQAHITRSIQGYHFDQFKSISRQSLPRYFRPTDRPTTFYARRKLTTAIRRQRRNLIWIGRVERAITPYVNSTHVNPGWMALRLLPIIPPDVRPMVELDEGLMAVSDLNKFYQRVISRQRKQMRLLKTRRDYGYGGRNLRYHGIADRVTAESQVRLLQRLTQYAVDNLMENGKAGARPLTATNDRPLKSLSDHLKGKQGRFRQNLLGKRVDYSGRSVIVSGPTLRVHECGLPVGLALILYQNHLLRYLWQGNRRMSYPQAQAWVRDRHPLALRALKRLVESRPVLLNRAPTLHRLGVQAFKPVLVSGQALHLHPLVCSAFNADFDGDQMAVHLPLTVKSVQEAWVLMWSCNQLYSAATGGALLLPSQDMVLGTYVLTAWDRRGRWRHLRSRTTSNDDNRTDLIGVDLNDRAMHHVIWLRRDPPYEFGRAQPCFELQVQASGLVSSLHPDMKSHRAVTGSRTAWIKTTVGRGLAHERLLLTPPAIAPGFHNPRPPRVLLVPPVWPVPRVPRRPVTQGAGRTYA